MPRTALLNPQLLTPVRPTVITTGNIPQELTSSVFHCQIDCQILYNNYHLKFRDIKTSQN
jgi:hypothetical protein